MRPGWPRCWTCVWVLEPFPGGQPRHEMMQHLAGSVSKSWKTQHPVRVSSSPNLFLLSDLNLWIPLGPQSALAVTPQAHPAQNHTALPIKPVHYDLLRHITPSLPFLPSAISIPTCLRLPCPSTSRGQQTPPTAILHPNLPMPHRPAHRCTSLTKIHPRCLWCSSNNPIAAASPSTMAMSSRVHPRKRDDDKLWVVPVSPHWHPMTRSILIPAPCQLRPRSSLSIFFFLHFFGSRAHTKQNVNDAR
jgi:hypothetical protein